MELGLSGKTALVTGSTRGIGLAIARSLLENGTKVIVHGRDEARLNDVVRDLQRVHGAAVSGVCADITSEAQRHLLAIEIEDRTDELSILVNNVGGTMQSQVSASASGWRDTFDRNVWSGSELTWLLYDKLKASPDPCVLFVASIWGREKGPQYASRPYQVAKAAEIALAQALADELAPDGIRVNAIAPGPIRVAGGSWDESAAPSLQVPVKEAIPLCRFGVPEDVANLAAFLCSPRALWITGACIPVDGGMSRSR